MSPATVNTHRPPTLGVEISHDPSWCRGGWSLWVTLHNTSQATIHVVASEWLLEDAKWPGQFWYWDKLSERESRGGMTPVLACSCSHGPCEEPCGGPDRTLSFAPGARRRFEIPIKLELVGGDHAFDLQLVWREQIPGGSLQSRRHDGSWHLGAGEAKNGCAPLRLDAPPNKPLQVVGAAARTRA
jgi:hypothetical protein